MKLAILFVCLFASQSAALFESIFGGGVEWNGLTVGFGINPFTAFQGQPRTASEATNQGWKLDNTAGPCSSQFNGYRYKKDNDPAIMLLFDVNGYIAGIQGGIPKTLSSYPAPQNAKYDVFLEEKDMWVVTAYFTDPSKICTTGRSQTNFDQFGTGNMLAIQTGKSASDLMRIPIEEKDVVPNTKFVQGKCFWTMGMHYWYNIDKNMSCDDTFPVFLLYNNKKLNGFGWAFNPNYDNSGKWEHPDKSQFGMFMKEPPTCLGKDAPVTTLHIYMTNSPRLGNHC